MATTPTLRPQDDPYSVVVATVALLAALIYLSTLIGPAAGWLERMADAMAPTAAPGASPAAGQPPPPRSSHAAPPAPSTAALPAPAPDATTATATSPATPDELAAVVQQMEVWLAEQQRRQGRLFDRIYGERTGSHAVLHVLVLPAFRLLPQKGQVAALEVIARQWAARCRDAAVVHRRQDALLLVHEVSNPAAIIGGGSAGETAGIWVKP